MDEMSVQVLQHKEGFGPTRNGSTRGNFRQPRKGKLSNVAPFPRSSSQQVALTPTLEMMRAAWIADSCVPAQSERPHAAPHRRHFHVDLVSRHAQGIR